MMKSNVSIRPNVFRRSVVFVSQDREFIAQVRGRPALLTLLKHVAPHQDPKTAARHILTQKQLSEVAWQARCAVCSSLPEGSVTVNGLMQIQFRCPRGTCEVGNLVPRTILVDRELLFSCTKKYGKAPEELVAIALSANGSYAGPTDNTRSTNRVRVPVRLTRTQYYFLADEDIEHALRRLLGSGR